MAAVFLHGLSLENFRGISAKAFIGPFQDFNFFIGPNNAGKSTLLLFLSKYLHSANGQDRWVRSFAPEDALIGKRPHEIEFAFGVPLENSIDLIARNESERFREELSGFLVRVAANRGGLLWVKVGDDKNSTKLICDIEEIEAVRNDAWQHIWHILSGRSSRGGSLEYWSAGALNEISRHIVSNYPRAHLIPAIREVSEKGVDFKDYSGRGLIDKLAELQNPAHDERHLRSKFDSINSFLQAVTDSPGAQIEIPYDRRYVLVHMGGKRCPCRRLARAYTK